MTKGMSPQRVNQKGYANSPTWLALLQTKIEKFDISEGSFALSH
jgi:hypothetical protein